LSEAVEIPELNARIEAVRALRLASPDKGARTTLAKRPHQLKLMRIGRSHTLVVPSVSSERRAFLPAGIVDGQTALTNLAFGLYDAALWNLALIASRVHLVWIAGSMPFGVERPVLTFQPPVRTGWPADA
jgi:hypothetical protein